MSHLVSLMDGECELFYTTLLITSYHYTKHILNHDLSCKTQKTEAIIDGNVNYLLLIGKNDMRRRSSQSWESNTGLYK